MLREGKMRDFFSSGDGKKKREKDSCISSDDWLKLTNDLPIDANGYTHLECCL